MLPLSKAATASDRSHSHPTLNFSPQIWNGIMHRRTKRTALSHFFFSFWNEQIELVLATSFQGNYFPLVPLCFARPRRSSICRSGCGSRLFRGAVETLQRWTMDSAARTNEDGRHQSWLARRYARWTLRRRQTTQLWHSS